MLMDILWLWYVFALQAGLELLLYLLPFWKHARYRRVFASVLAIVLAFVTGALLFAKFTFLLVLVTFVGLYRLFNLLRVVENRAHARHLRAVAARTSIILLVVQGGLLLLQTGVERWHVPLDTWFYTLASAQVAVAGVLLTSTLRRLQRTQLRASRQSLATSELPTVSVAIPARNETDDLEACLQSLIANEYPKLEILVLDDCSQTRRTPEIIRDFAHDGVRFLKGEPPAENWLAKNQAYEKLADEASGELLLFCGVDVRFESDTIRKLVTEMVARNKRMLSVVPLRQQLPRPVHSFVQAARYLWELTPPRRLFKRPPVLSSCWLIYRPDLRRLGSFAAVSRTILPEAYFAKHLLPDDGYSFLRGSRALGLTSAKSYEAQRQTAVRTRYPQLRKRPENVMAFTLMEVTFLLAPFLLILLGLGGFVPFSVLLLAAVASGCLIASHVLVVRATGLQRGWTALWSMPGVVITDLGLMHVSMQQYEFSEVIWKGRNICVPVMHVIPSLPKA